jgi:hypothetical protein
MEKLKHSEIVLHVNQRQLVKRQRSVLRKVDSDSMRVITW